MKVLATNFPMKSFRRMELTSTFSLYFSGRQIPLHLQFPDVFVATYAGTDRSSLYFSFWLNSWLKMHLRVVKKKMKQEITNIRTM